MSESVSQSVSDKVTYGAVLGQLKICYLKIKDLVCLAQCSLQFDKNFSYYSDLLYQENLENLLGKKVKNSGELLQKLLLSFARFVDRA